MSRLAVIVAAVSALILVPAAALADADDVYPWSAPSAGPVTITDAHFFMYGFHMMECVSFKNATDKPIAALQFRFRFYGRDGAVVEENTQTRKGSFGPGVEIAGAGGSGNAANSARLSANCWSYAFQKNDPVWAAITVPSVAYADGTTVAAEEKVPMSDLKATVAVALNGWVTLNGRLVSFEQFYAMLDHLKLAHGVIWYTRDGAAGEPTREQMKVFEKVVAAGLPVAFFTDRTFKTRVPEH